MYQGDATTAAACRGERTEWAEVSVQTSEVLETALKLRVMGRVRGINSSLCSHLHLRPL